MRRDFAVVESQRVQRLLVPQNGASVVPPLSCLRVHHVLRQYLPALGGDHLQRFQNEGQFAVRHEERQGHSAKSRSHVLVVDWDFWSFDVA